MESLDTELLSRTKLRSTSGTMYLVYFVTLTHWWKVELSNITFTTNEVKRLQSALEDAVLAPHTP